MPAGTTLDVYSIAALAAGSALGGAVRFLLANLSESLWGTRFPWGTLVVNLSGAFAAGWLGALIVSGQLQGTLLLFLLSGGLGSYTTVSAVSLQTLLLANQGRSLAAVSNIATHLLVGLALAAIGFSLGRAIHA